jgi:hypothetical protein
MRRTRLLPVVLLLLASACKKEKPLLTARFQATCRNCIVSRAIGSDQSRKDTLRGIAVSPGDTIAETRQWSMELQDGQNIFFRACRLYEDTSYGAMSLHVDGDVKPMDAQGDTSATCITINAAGRKN